MLVASVCVDDILVTCTKVQGLEKGAEPFYRLTFTDLPTKETAVIDDLGENESLMLLSAWIMADEPEAMGAHYEALCERLVASGWHGKLLP